MVSRFPIGIFVKYVGQRLQAWQNKQLFLHRLEPAL